jgi:hypothetical protein
MGLTSKIQEAAKPEQKDHTLLKEEYEFLFSVMKETTFKGEQVQVVYNSIRKLQEQYLFYYGNR